MLPKSSVQTATEHRKTPNLETLELSGSTVAFIRNRLQQHLIHVTMLAESSDISVLLGLSMLCGSHE